MNFDAPAFAKEGQEVAQLKTCERSGSAREWRMALSKSNHHHQDLHSLNLPCSCVVRFSGQSHFMRPLSSSIAEWNPFDDNFNTEADDFMFGAEFDKIRRGSNTSELTIQSSHPLKGDPKQTCRSAQKCESCVIVSICRLPMVVLAIFM